MVRCDRSRATYLQSSLLWHPDVLPAQFSDSCAQKDDADAVRSFQPRAFLRSLSRLVSSQQLSELLKLLEHPFSVFFLPVERVHVRLVIITVYGDAEDSCAVRLCNPQFNFSERERKSFVGALIALIPGGVPPIAEVTRDEINVMAS